MAKKRRSTPRANTRSRAKSKPKPISANFQGLDSDMESGFGESSATTGRKIVTILSDDPKDRKKVLDYFSARDVKDMLETADYEESAFSTEDASKSEAIVMDNLPILILNEKPNIMTALNAEAVTVADEETRRLFVIEEEMRHFPSGSPFGDASTGACGCDDSGGSTAANSGLSTWQQGYLEGVRAMADQLLGGKTSVQEMLSSGGAISGPMNFSQCVSNDQSFAWGIKATGVANSSLTGRGIKVAILDTGFEFGHPDANFASRVIGHHSSVGGSAQDHDGHGTHVAGTACGPRSPGFGTRRYGVASEAEILVSRVLGPSGGNDSTILAGINWAVGQNCDLINMSLGPRVCHMSRPYSTSHERVAQVALQNGILIIAAAGNNSRRPHRTCQVVGPAAAPSIVAVGAVDRCGRIAPFSNQGQVSGGGEINLCAPGVEVFSAWLNPSRHRSIPGTSMASPHVCGIAALIAEETDLRGLPLYQELRRRAVNIGHRSADMGHGFVQV